MQSIQAARWARRGMALVTGFSVFLALGCGNRPYPVDGQVVFQDGTPAKELAGYLVMFESAEHNVSANGTINADGSFTVGTFNDGDGAMQGKQRVAITPPMAELDTPRPSNRIPNHYAHFDTSGLEVEIKPQRNKITLTVERTR